MDDDLKARLLKPRVPEGTVELEGLGTVRVRGLSRGEVFLLRKDRDNGVIKDEGAWEVRMVALGMVEPAMSQDDVREWQAASPAGGELQQVTEKISDLSGLSEGADKSGVPGVRDESGV